MDYYEFVCAGTPAMSVATADPDPAHIPGAALSCCREWQFRKAFRLGDGSHSATLDAAIQVRVAGEGYYIFPNGSPAESQQRTRAAKVKA